MINTNEIVPVQATDLITLYGTIMKIANISVEALTGTDGEYQVKTNSKTYIADALQTPHTLFRLMTLQV